MSTADTLPGHNLQSFKGSIVFSEISELLPYLHTIDVVVIDCFEAFLQYKEVSYSDLFYDLCEQSIFKEYGITARIRMEGEEHAAKINRIKHRKIKPTLHEIYQVISSALTPEQIHTLMHEEIIARMNTCYIAPPMLDFICTAHARGKKVILFSNSNFTEQQLQSCLERNVSPAILKDIDKIVCSFQEIVEDFHLPTSTILHVGGAQTSLLAKQSGINSLQLIQYSSVFSEILRMQVIAASILDPTIRISRSLTNSFLGIVAADTNNIDPNHLLGYITLGPILYSFAHYIKNEIQRIQQIGKNPKVVFLMRDGYLPFLASEAFSDVPLGKCVRISRFSAIASSFLNYAEIEHYLAAQVETKRFQDICSQLLLPVELTQRILQKTEGSTDSINAFLLHIQQNEILDLVIENSKHYRERLKRYLKNEIDLTSGDTLMFVDLGYTGTAQCKLEPIFKSELNVDIIGCYLIAVQVPNTQSSHRGLLDYNSYDDKALSTLITHISIFEKLCSPYEGSVIDFDDQGQPIFAKINVSPDQLIKQQSIQAECLRFIKDAKLFFDKAHLTLSLRELKDAAAINLSRLIYFPTQTEIQHLQDFKADVNLGTKEILPLIDLKKSVIALRRRTWLNYANEPIQNMRLDYPAELRHADLNLSIMRLSQLRHGFDIALSDASLRREQLHIIYLSDSDKPIKMALEAMATQDGYYSLLVPIMPDKQCVIQFGEKYRWVELESAEIISLKYLFSRSEFEHTQDASPYLLVDQMSDKEGGLFESLSQFACLAFIPPSHVNKENAVLRITFRPIVNQVDPQPHSAAFNGVLGKQ